MVGKRNVSPDTPAHRSWRAHARGLAVDLSPLRSRDFRLLWTGEIFSEIGSNVTLVAVLLQVDALTHDPAAVGLIGLVQLIPLMAASLLGGRGLTASTVVACCSARRSVKRAEPQCCSPARS